MAVDPVPWVIIVIIGAVEAQHVLLYVGTSLYPHSLGNWFINVLSVEHSASAPAPVAVPAGAHLLRSRFVVAVLKDMLSIWGSHIVCRRKREKATD